jgi:hypothetical protein
MEKETSRPDCYILNDNDDGWKLIKVWGIYVCEEKTIKNKQFHWYHVNIDKLLSNTYK